ncbi:transcription elongation factor GreA [bacterium]|nr:transcription elongation factor GreA [bacterium]
MTSFPITVAGYMALQKELGHLRKIERPEIIEKIAEARSHGDLKENAEYHAAREKQGFIEGKIQKYEGMMADAEVIKHTQLSGDVVLFGATVTLYEMDTEEEVTYQLVGEYESDLKANKLSITAPIAQALLGKEIGDEVIVRTPSGERGYEILDVEFI